MVHFDTSTDALVATLEIYLIIMLALPSGYVEPPLVTSITGLQWNYKPDAFCGSTLLTLSIQYTIPVFHRPQKTPPIQQDR